ncbi:hypothetical protein [Dyadobacter sediminis]|uniref:Uncharacterized protein n=1 Tax=Dyadobacter sediminis TaxID=1493691 RepID=A0A5R9KIR1_9BACT|nr:hypothetical protein [Dyadobacter sediminis]TLU96113.1 hypothetical protein FEM55_02910 [Dyadobacter sediminis]GGB79374.1 hypothetical protein GCM10011325_03630 [Dyadobacter sediminis]
MFKENEVRRAGERGYIKPQYGNVSMFERMRLDKIYEEASASRPDYHPKNHPSQKYTTKFWGTVALLWIVLMAFVWYVFL